jgi:hypothetical protein
MKSAISSSYQSTLEIAGLSFLTLRIGGSREQVCATRKSLGGSRSAEVQLSQGTVASVSWRPSMKSFLLAITLLLTASSALILARPALADGCGGCTLATTDFGPRGNQTTSLLVTR